MSAAASWERSPELGAKQPRAIHSALTVLEAVARRGPGVTAREVSDELGLPRATTYRLLNLLVQEEYLVRLPDLRGFALSRKVAALAGAAEAPTVPRAVRERLAALRLRFRGGVTLVGYRDERLLLLDVDPDYPLSDPRRLQAEPGASALGRLLLAERARLGDPLRAGRAAFEELRREGVTSQRGELRPGGGCLAAPVVDASGALVAGLAMSASLDRLDDAAPIVALLRDGAAELAPLLA